MKFKLSSYIIPTIISMVLIGTYTNIDGLFIGNVAGDTGLAAINIAWPIVAFITSLGTGLGVGGAVIISHLRGQGKDACAEEAKYSALFILTSASIIFTAVCLAIFYPLLRLMGAEGQVLKYACEYSLIISAGASFQILGSGIVVLLRSDGKTFSSMFYTFIGLLVHIVLDILLVKKYVLYGVAFSTVLSQLTVMLLGIFTLKFKRYKLFHVKEIIKNSTAPFGVNFVSSLTLLFTNFFALKVGGTAAVSAYAVMSYAVYTYDYIYLGICDGSQPVLSFTVGEEHKSEHRRTVITAISLLIGFSLCFIALTPLVSRFLPVIFKVSESAEKMMQQGLIIYAFSYLFKAAVKWMCAYCYSTRRLWIANLLTYIDPLVLTPLTLLILPLIWGINGIWLSLTVSQITAALLGGILLFISSRKKTQAHS